MPNIREHGMVHELADDGESCKHCGMDLVEADWYRKTQLAELGSDEYRARLQHGEYDDTIYCQTRFEVELAYEAKRRSENA